MRFFGAQSGAKKWGKAKTRLLTDSQSLGKVTFAHVAGYESQKADLQETVLFLKGAFKGATAKIPRGVLLIGPPGDGKTLIARAVAGEADVPFFTISGSDFVEMFVGVGASRVRDMFEQARMQAPASSLSMKLMLWDVIVELVWGEATTRRSRR